MRVFSAADKLGLGLRDAVRSVVKKSKIAYVLNNDKKGK